MYSTLITTFFVASLSTFFFSHTHTPVFSISPCIQVRTSQFKSRPVKSSQVFYLTWLDIPRYTIQIKSSLFKSSQVKSNEFNWLQLTWLTQLPECNGAPVTFRQRLPEYYREKAKRAGRLSAADCASHFHIYLRRTQGESKARRRPIFFSADCDSLLILPAGLLTREII